MWLLYTLLLLPLVCVVCLLIALRRYLTKTVACPSKNRLTGRTVIITGAGSGIGLVTARECARRGARLIVTCRNKLRAEKLAIEITNETMNDTVYGLHLDLSSFNSVEQFFISCCERFNKVDTLINNAAYMGPAEITEDGLDKSLQVNYLSHLYLTYLLYSHYQDIDGKEYFRVINVASCTHSVGEALRALKTPITMKLSSKNTSKQIEGTKSTQITQESGLSLAEEWIRANAEEENSFVPYSNWWEFKSLDGYEAYAVTKFFLQLFSFELHARHGAEGENSSENMIVLSVNPGPTRTGLQRHLPGLFGKFIRLIALLLFRSPEDGAQSVIHCTVLGDDEARAWSGAFITDCALDETLISRFRDIRNYCACIWPRSIRLCQERNNMNKFCVQKRVN